MNSGTSLEITSSGIESSDFRSHVSMESEEFTTPSEKKYNNSDFTLKDRNRILVIVFLSFCAGFLIAFLSFLFLYLLFFHKNFFEGFDDNIEDLSKPGSDETHIIGWRSDESFGFFPSSQGLQSLEYSKSHEGIHFFSVGEDIGSQNLYEVEVNVGKISVDEIKGILDTPTQDRSSIFTEEGEEKDFECVGLCWCDILTDRKSASVGTTRSASYIVTALSLTVAYSLAQKHFKEELCPSESSLCPTGTSIFSSVDECQEVEDFSFHHQDNSVLGLYYALLAFTRSHDVLTFSVRAENEEEAIKLGVELALEEFEKFWMDFQWVTDPIQYLFIYRLFERLSGLKKAPLNPRYVKVDCCTKCKGRVIPFRKKKCCEFPMEVKEYEHLFDTPEKFRYANDLSGLAGGTLQKLCDPEGKSPKRAYNKILCVISTEPPRQYEFCSLNPYG